MLAKKRTLINLSFKRKKNFHYHNSWKSNNYRQSNQHRTDTKNETMNIKIDHFTVSNGEKFNNGH